MNSILHTETILAFRAGNQKAFSEVFNFFYGNLFLFARRLTSSAEESEDIVMRTFASLFNRCNHFETETNIKAFLYISVRNQCLNYLKYRQRNDEKLQEFAIQMSDDTLLEYEYAIATDVLESIQQAIAKLPLQCRKIFKMLYYEEMSPADVAVFLNISVNTVYTQKRRAIQTLQLALSENSSAIAWLLLTLAILQSKVGQPAQIV